MVYESYEEIVAQIEARESVKTIELCEGINGSGQPVFFMFTLRYGKVIAMDRFSNQAERDSYAAFCAPMKPNYKN